MISEPQKHQFAKMLESVSDELDLTPTQYEDAREKYRLVGEWLGEPETDLYPFSPEIYPQGSIKLRTAVKPLRQEEFDVDLVCEMKIPASVGQSTVMNLVKNRLGENPKYRGIMIPKKRCLKLDFKGAFHMDVLPAIPDAVKGNCCLLVPDRELKRWMPSNPKGYAEWFESRMKVVMESIMRAKAEVEDLPDNYLTRTPLQRAVQILKRMRDITFFDRRDSAPISIVITTLAAKAYNNEPDLFDTLMNVIEGMPGQIDVLKGFPAVLNPTNGEENFAEKWIQEPSLYEIFLYWLKNLKQGLNAPLTKKGGELHESLTPMFGETIAKGALKRYAETINVERKAGSLKMAAASGMLGTKGYKIPTNTFYGD